MEKGHSLQACCFFFLFFQLGRRHSRVGRRDPRRGTPQQKERPDPARGVRPSPKVSLGLQSAGRTAGRIFLCPPSFLCPGQLGLSLLFVFFVFFFFPFQRERPLRRDGPAEGEAAPGGRPAQSDRSPPRAAGQNPREVPPGRRLGRRRSGPLSGGANGPPAQRASPQPPPPRLIPPLFLFCLSFCPVVQIRFSPFSFPFSIYCRTMSTPTLNKCENKQ
jgi:hypothetical protein